jgi:transcriptional regulator with XRE-family HTH domain
LRGQVSGYVWKLIRESIGMTQLQLAEDLLVDVATVQGWESGRRPLTAVKAGDLATLRLRLIRRGAAPRLFSVLNDAIEADTILEHVLAAEQGAVSDHPLAATVHRRDLTNLITWPLNGVLPAQLRRRQTVDRQRRGPAPSQPTLSQGERRRFFEQLIRLADLRDARSEPLLRRQAMYLLSFDAHGATKDWLMAEHNRCQPTFKGVDVTQWVAMRSVAIALTRHGQREALNAFMTSLCDHQHEMANLTYWAYWLGEIKDVRTDDSFMRSVPIGSWAGARVMGHLAERINPTADQLELNVRTLWQLVLAKPYLLTQAPELRDRVAVRVEETLGSAEVDKQARQELSDVVYAIRFAKR